MNVSTVIEIYERDVTSSFKLARRHLRLARLSRANGDQRQRQLLDTGLEWRTLAHESREVARNLRRRQEQIGAYVARSQRALERARQARLRGDMRTARKQLALAGLERYGAQLVAESAHGFIRRLAQGYIKQIVQGGPPGIYQTDRARRTTMSMNLADVRHAIDSGESFSTNTMSGLPLGSHLTADTDTSKAHRTLLWQLLGWDTATPAIQRLITDAPNYVLINAKGQPFAWRTPDNVWHSADRITSTALYGDVRIGN